MAMGLPLPFGLRSRKALEARADGGQARRPAARRLITLVRADIARGSLRRFLRSAFVHLLGPGAFPMLRRLSLSATAASVIVGAELAKCDGLGRLSMELSEDGKSCCSESMVGSKRGGWSIERIAAAKLPLLAREVTLLAASVAGLGGVADRNGQAKRSATAASFEGSDVTIEASSVKDKSLDDGRGGSCGY